MCELVVVSQRISFFQTRGHNSKLRSFKFILNWSFMFSDFWQFMSASTYSNRKINLNKLLEPLRTIRKNELFFPQILCAFLVCIFSVQCVRNAYFTEKDV